MLSTFDPIVVASPARKTSGFPPPDRSMSNPPAPVPAVAQIREPSDSQPKSTTRPPLAERIGGFRHPRLGLALAIVLMYAATLFHPFLLDDYRIVRRCADFHAGDIASLRLYEFIETPEDVRALRKSGVAPWWVFENFRFTYFRPLTERFLYTEYLVFGRHVIGYRATGLALYVLGVWMVLAIYRAWLGDEHLARFAVLIFAVAACNAVPVAFIAAQCDLLAFLAVTSAVLCATRLVMGGTWAWLLPAVAAYGAGLASKEATLPAAILPAVMLVALWRRCDPADRRHMLIRAAAVTGLLLGVAGAFLVFYGGAGYGSNSVLLLNPLSDPFDYLTRMPLHILMLLTCWITQTNCIVTYMYGDYPPAIAAYCVAGGALLLLFARMYWRRFRHHAAGWSFVLWATAFLPLLACTNPDSRVLMLPMVGLAVPLALWLTGRTEQPGRGAFRADCGSIDGHSRGSIPPITTLAALPAVLYLFLPGMINGGTTGSLQLLERKAAATIEQGIAGFNRPVSRDDQIFLLNTAWQGDLLWAQDRTEFLHPESPPRMRYLSHMANVTPQVLDSHTLRLTSVDTPFFGPFLGRLSAPTLDIEVGTAFDAGEFVATIAEVGASGDVTAVDFTFRDPLDSDRYRFYEVFKFSALQAWSPAS
jgi:hypothetical protein